ncbi:response regulator transcription factor [Solirubrobacter soli]|uniref:response regulator transcription factor n=1 Tax=Solirubrobacter soli TaxID=363832 RepID=UPI00041787F5|nr:response regulator transcription factor [Solirubrobacter soli]
MRVLLIDREGAARLALSFLLRNTPGVELAGEAGSRAEIALALRTARPDVVVVDDRLVDEVPTVMSPVRVIVMGVDDDPAFAARAHRLGAEAWMAKDLADDQLPALLEAR